MRKKNFTSSAVLSVARARREWKEEQASKRAKNIRLVVEARRGSSFKEDNTPK